MPTIPIFRVLPNALIDCAFTERDYGGSITKGGRWNSVGTPMVYTSDNVSTAGWEIAQRVEIDPSVDPGQPLRERILKILSDSYSYYLATIDTSQIIHVENFCGVSLPAGWHLKLPGMVYRPEIQAIGDRWVKSKSSLALCVPCALTRRHAFNYLLNPWHPDYAVLASTREGYWRFDGEEHGPSNT
jgi:RES domain-containing protein